MPSPKLPNLAFTLSPLAGLFLSTEVAIATPIKPKPESEVDVVAGARQLVQSRRNRHRREANELIEQAKHLQDGERICTAKAKVRDAEGKPIKDENGRYLTRPCRKYAIKGGSVCVLHGGRSPQVRRKAERRLLAMVEPSIIRLEALVHQDEHLPTALGAIKEILNRAGGIPLGPVAESGHSQDTRPVINIGIAVGGIQAGNTPPQPVIAAEVLGSQDE